MRTAVVSAVIAAIVVGILLLGGDVKPTSPNSFVVLGLANGAVFGLVALGLVLVYKGARVFNFAHGEIGTLAAYALLVGVSGEKEKFGFGLRGLDLPYWLAIVMALVVAIGIGLLFERLIVRPLLNSPRVTVLVATIAAALFAVGMEIIVFKAEPRPLDPVVSGFDKQGDPTGPEVFGLILQPQQLISIGVLAAFAALLAYFFSRTDLGLAVLAISQDSFATRVVGVGVERMSRFIWVSAAFLAAIAGILYVPIAGSLQPGVMTSNILIPAFTGAVIGGMTSLPGAFVGGVVVGLVQTISQWASTNFTVGDPPRAFSEIIPGTEQLALLVVLLIVLLARPQGLLGREA